MTDIAGGGSTRPPTDIQVFSDVALVSFLQWALPRLSLRWGGYRKVRHLLGKRLKRRMTELSLTDLSGYRALLLREPAEWRALDALCRIPISRFYRDRRVWDAIGQRCLGAAAAAALARDEMGLRCWSAGCASGEEPYTLAMLWGYRVRPLFPTIRLDVFATDADETMLARAKAACYAAGSLKELPREWIEGGAFRLSGNLFCLAAEFRDDVTLEMQDIRYAMPEGPFDLILCRNLVFTYFDQPLQCRILERLQRRLHAGGFLVIGSHEKLPAGADGLCRIVPGLPIYRAGKPAAARRHACGSGSGLR